MLFTDLGSYCTQAGASVLPWPVLRDAGVEGAIFKGDQEDLSRGVSTLKSIEQAYEGGARTVGCFYWEDPTVAVSVLLDAYSRAIERERPDFFAVDIEQYFDWAGVTLDPDFLNAHAQALVEGLVARHPELFFLIYSARYMLGYIPGMAGWIDRYHQWTAAWPDSPGERYELPLAEIAAGHVRQTIMRNPDGTYKQAVIDITQNWQAATYNRVCELRQYSSRILLPSKLVGGTIYSHQYDWDYAPETIEEWLAKIGKKETPLMAGIYDSKIPMAERAWVFEYKSDAKVPAGLASLGVDGLILPMVNTSWDGSHWHVAAEPTFIGRFDEAKAAAKVFGVVQLNAALVTDEMHSQEELDGHDVWQNLVAPKILDAWHIGPWSRESLKPADFRGVDILLFEQLAEVDHLAKPITEFWQAKWFRYVVDHLRVLMTAGAVPNVPIALKTSCTWLQKYLADYSIMLQDGRASWLYLALSDPKLDSTSVYNQLWDIFKYAPDDTYKYPYVPDHYDQRVLLYEFTKDKQVMSFVTGNATARLSKAFTDAAGLGSFLGAAAPPDIPPVPPADPDLEARVVALENLAAAMRGQADVYAGQIAALEEEIVALGADSAILAKLEAWAKGFPTFLG